MLLERLRLTFDRANIAHGPQQVNNTLNRTKHAPAGLARAGNHETEQNKLWEAHGNVPPTKLTGVAISVLSGFWPTTTEWK